jgi:hypothetical protein
LLERLGRDCRIWTPYQYFPFHIYIFQPILRAYTYMTFQIHMGGASFCFTV